MNRLLLTLLSSAALALVAHAAEATPLAVGAAVPTVNLHAETGAVISLRDALGGKPTVLIFYRGGWCPFCTRHLAALGEAQPALTAAGFQLIAISPDRPEKLRARPTHEHLPFTLYSDSKMQATQAFGIAFKVEDAAVARWKESHGIDLESDSGETHHLLPHPAVFIVDAGGTIRYAHVNPDYKVRMSPEEIIAAANQALHAGH